MVKYVRQNVVPALESAASKPRGKALLQTVKTVAIDFDSNVGGNKCNIDRTVLTLRSNWNTFPVETSGCARAFAMAAEPNRRVD